MSTEERIDVERMFPPQVLRQYALLADGERGALIGPQGDIVVSGGGGTRRHR